MALKYYEQQTQAIKNFLQMQCLASSYNMQIVEPFLFHSTISFPFTELADEQVFLNLGDLIDINLWNNRTTSKYGYPPIAKWNEFLKYAPREVVIVCIKYRNPPHIPIPIPGHDFRMECNDHCIERFVPALRYLRKYNFRMVGNVCTNFVNYAGSITTEAFFENFGIKKDTTVILNEFRGFFGLYRMQLLSPCGVIHTKVDIPVVPSEKLIQEAKEYAAKNFDGEQYASILVRIERLVLHSHRNVTKCGEEVLAVLKRLEVERYIDRSFLAMDVGRFGSSGSTLNNLRPIGEALLHQLYGKSKTFRNWEKSFTAVASNENPAYVANLQRTIASQGTCLLMVGDGGFQAQARRLYEAYHPDPHSHCIFKICGDAKKY